VSNSFNKGSRQDPYYIVRRPLKGQGFEPADWFSWASDRAGGFHEAKMAEEPPASDRHRGVLSNAMVGQI